MSEYTEEPVPRRAHRSGEESPFHPRSEVSSGYFSSTPNTPLSISPPHTLKRSRSSSFRLINRRTSNISNSSLYSVLPESEDRLAAWIGWYPSIIVRMLLEIASLFFFVAIKNLPFVLPTLWLSGCLWIFWKCVMLPLSIIKSILIFIFVPASERRRNKRTILISGGSTVQAIHLARNFYSAGARIVVVEIEGKFGLARFSTAVAAFYTIPEPSEDKISQYVNALKEIVVKEEVACYVPVSESSTAYYDAFAKPALTSLGCECICPDLRDVLILDDLNEVMRRIQAENMVTPIYHLLHSYTDLKRAYDHGHVKNEPHTLIAVGPAGCKRRQQIDISSKKHVRVPTPLNDQNPWLLIQGYRGEQYVTCTTLRDSQVVANVICRTDDLNGLIPVEVPAIEEWLQQFFAKLKFNGKIIGHMSFEFIVADGHVILMGCQVGIRKPYICYTSVQSRIVVKPCRHFSRHKSGPIVTGSGKYWLNEVILKIIEYPSLDSISRLFEIISGKNEVLFAMWDPLPYCAYYYIQLPLSSIANIYNKFVRNG